jgi:hypothetical protein
MREIRIISKENILEDRRARGVTVPHATLKEPIARLVTSQPGLAAIARKVVMDVTEGRAENPTLYEAIYTDLFDDSLPQSVDTNLFNEAEVLFLERMEGEEVKFGTVQPGQGSSVPIVGYSAGFQWTREMEKWNQLWRIELFNKAFGRAHNALLNDIHLGPIITATLTGDNATAADTTGATLLDKTRNTLIAATRQAALKRRPGTILLASMSDKYNLLDAISIRRDQQGNELPQVEDISTIIYYDGDSIKVGEKVRTFAGVAPKTCYLIRPKSMFISLCATENGQDLIVESGNGDVSRGIREQLVAHTYRGVYAAVADNVQKITLP